MFDIDVDIEISGPASRVWELITDTSRWSEWGPSVSAVESPVRFISQGTRGRVKTAAGIWLPFEITRFEEGRSWTWRVMGIPATGHRVETIDAQRCRLIFSVPMVAAPYASVCRIALKRIKELCESDSAEGSADTR